MRRHGQLASPVGRATRALSGELTMDLQNKTVTDRIFSCAIAVHRILGPGLLESAYQAALAIEFDAAGILFQQQVEIPAMYRNRLLGKYRLDFIVEQAVVVEVKSVE